MMEFLLKQGEGLPPNYTTVLALLVDSGSMHYAPVKYFHKFYEEASYDDECVQEYNEDTDKYYVKEGWYAVAFDSCDFSSYAFDGEVVAWFELPSPKIMESICTSA